MAKKIKLVKEWSDQLNQFMIYFIVNDGIVISFYESEKDKAIEYFNATRIRV
jgi:hypothetical protein